jgi:hypothetical protein
MIPYDDKPECLLYEGALLFSWVENTNEQSRKD